MSASHIGMLASSFRRSPPGPPSFSNVKLLMHMEGQLGTQTYKDRSSHNRSIVGSSAALLDNTFVYRGLSSLNITSGVNLNVPVDPAIGNTEWARMGTNTHPLTAEIAFCMTSSNVGALFGAPQLTGGAFNWLSVILNISALSHKVTVAFGTVSADVPLLTTPSSGAFHMLAIQITGTTSHIVGVWLDGVWQGSVNMGDTIITYTGPFGVGDEGLNISRLAGANQYLGWFDEFRISEEVFLPWATNYTPRTGPFPNY